MTQNKIEMTSENLTKLLTMMKWFQFLVPGVLFLAAAADYYFNGLGDFYVPVFLTVFGILTFWSSHYRVMPQLQNLADAPPKKSLIKVQGKAKIKSRK